MRLGEETMLVGGKSRSGDDDGVAKLQLLFEMKAAFGEMKTADAIPG